LERVYTVTRSREARFCSLARIARCVTRAQPTHKSVHHPPEHNLGDDEGQAAIERAGAHGADAKDEEEGEGHGVGHCRDEDA